MSCTKCGGGAAVWYACMDMDCPDTVAPPQHYQRKGDKMSVILRPDFAKPHRIPISGATLDDIAVVRVSIDMLFSTCLLQLMGLLENLKENLPVDDAQMLNTESIYDIMRDLRSETLGVLEIISEK